MWTGCCIYQKPLAFGESSSEEDDDECEHCFGHVEKKKKNQKKEPGDNNPDENGHDHSGPSSSASWLNWININLRNQVLQTIHYNEYNQINGKLYKCYYILISKNNCEQTSAFSPRDTKPSSSAQRIGCQIFLLALFIGNWYRCLFLLNKNYLFLNINFCFVWLFSFIFIFAT